MKNKIKKIKVVALDVDGVLTDGRIIFDSDGKELKFFDVQDGFGMVMLKAADFKTAIITAKGSKVVDIRAQDLHVDRVFKDAFPKIHAYEQMMQDFNVTDDQVCFIGDDLPDVPILKRVGFAVTVKTAPLEVKKEVDYVTLKDGGRGAVREVVELILKSQGKWKEILKKYTT